MLKFISSLLFINFLFILSADGQICTTPIVNSPKLRGFYLGMKADEISKIFPLAQIPKADEFGYIEFTFSFFHRLLSYGEDESPNTIDTDKFKDYKGWETAKIELVDNKLVSLEIQYDDSIQWKNIAEFIKHFAKLNSLPTQWKDVDPAYYQQATLLCNGFSIDAEITETISPLIYILNLEAPKVLEQRKNDAIEKAKKTFKP